MKKIFVQYLIAAVLGVLAGLAAYLIQPTQWKAQALVRVGQISQSQSQSQSQNQNQNSYSVEPLTAVIERIKSKSFIKSVAERTKRTDVETLLNFDESAGMTIKSPRNSDSLVITVAGRSSELVRVSLEGVVSELISKHDAILKAYQADFRKELDIIDSEIDVLSKRMSVMTDKPPEGVKAVAGLVILTTQPALEYKLNRASTLREAISSANLRPSTLMEPIYVSERRILSSTWQACLLGALVGIVAIFSWTRWVKRD